MSLRDILCTSCGDVALSVDENIDASLLECTVCACFNCEEQGEVEVVDDGERAKLVFRVED